MEEEEMKGGEEGAETQNSNSPLFDYKYVDSVSLSLNEEALDVHYQR